MTTPRTNASHDQNFVSTLLGVSTTDGRTPVPVEVDPNSGGLVTSGAIMVSSYDYFSVAYPDGVTEVYTYKTGGSGGLTIATVTIVYTDSTKASVSTMART